MQLRMSKTHSQQKLSSLVLKMEKLHLVFVPVPAVGQLIPAVNAAKLLLNRHNHLSITVLVIKRSNNFDSKINNFIQSFVASTTFSSRIQFIDLPKVEPEISNVSSLIERQKPHVKQAVSKITQSHSTSDSPRLAGFVLDMFCTSMIDVANEFGVPSYIFFASSAAFLGLMLHLQVILDEKINHQTDLMDSGAELPVPSLVNSFSVNILASDILSASWFNPLIDGARRFKETKGVIVNTFLELESYAVKSFSDGKFSTPPVYSVGPILNVGSDKINNKGSKIMQWLDNQPPTSVVFLCFGSEGSFGVDQVKEIACALESSGHRFLWSLRRPSPTDKIELPTDYEDLLEVLPDGFLDRTVEVGKIIGWAPQIDILAHPAIGGFVSHCGWNSVLESIWYGVPIAAWPLYSEQQFNAFEIVIELGLAVEIKIDYRMKSEIIINSNEIERGIRCVMEQNCELRKKVKQMSEKSKKALMDGGSSYILLDRLINDVIDNMA